MIANVKKVKDVGVFKDYETKKTGLQKDFGKKNFIYGLNTYGKSTLCDIFKDVSDDATDRIQKKTYHTKWNESRYCDKLIRWCRYCKVEWKFLV